MIATWIAHDCLQLVRIGQESSNSLSKREERGSLPSDILPFYLVLLEPDQWQLQAADIRQASLDLSIQGRLGFKAHPDSVWQYSENKRMSSSVSSSFVFEPSVSSSGATITIRLPQEHVILTGQVRVPFHPSLYQPNLDIALQR